MRSGVNAKSTRPYHSVLEDMVHYYRVLQLRREGPLENGKW
jgi:hypothetical protein